MSFDRFPDDRPPSDFDPDWHFWGCFIAFVFAAAFWGGVALIVFKIIF
jgi:hypothetical protein